jgi:hypothetical protein
MRTLSTTELAMQDQVKADQREGFKIINTSPLANQEYVNGVYVDVHPIRYGGSFGGRNVWGL